MDDELELISQDLWRRANEVEESLHGLGTAEQWHAVQCLRDAAGNAMSACYWLRRHDTRYNPGQQMAADMAACAAAEKESRS